MARRPPLRVQIIGAERLAGKFRAMPREAAERVAPELAAGAERVRNRAVAGIAKPPKTGRLYTTRFWTDERGRLRRGPERVPHRASAPGEYPAADTGNLMRSIYADDPGEVLAQAESIAGAADLDVIQASVTADAEYAAPLEFKEPERGGRPFLRRALGEEADSILAAIMRALGGLGGGGGSAPPSGPAGPSLGPRPRPPRPSAPQVTADDLNRAEAQRLNAPPPNVGGEP